MPVFVAANFDEVRGVHEFSISLCIVRHVLVTGVVSFQDLYILVLVLSLSPPIRGVEKTQDFASARNAASAPRHAEQTTGSGRNAAGTRIAHARTGHLSGLPAYNGLAGEPFNYLQRTGQDCHALLFNKRSQRPLSRA